MIRQTTRTSRNLARRVSGFSMIEVLIAILVLGFGLLGFALLQTMSLRFAQSANYRTQATNLATDLLDQMRSNRLLAAQYEDASFTGGTVPKDGCPRFINTVPISKNIERWQCQVRAALGEGSSAAVTYNPAGGVASVTVTWGDERWQIDPTKRNQSFNVSTRL